jgi:hypothetical protein
MQAQFPATRGDVNNARDEVRYFSLEERELIDGDNERGWRVLGRNSAEFVEVACFVSGECFLASDDLGLKARQRPPRQASVEISELPDRVRQEFEVFCRSSTSVIDEEKDNSLW